MRTYTTRAVRPLLREVDVDMVLHGDGGPASRFAGSAAPGDVAALQGPDAGFDGDPGGLEFRAPAGTPVLLVADETAVPAALRILEELPSATTGEAVLEVPEHGDGLDVRGPAGVRVTWLPRSGAGAPGALLQPAVVDALARKVAAADRRPRRRRRRPGGPGRRRAALGGRRQRPLHRPLRLDGR